MSTKIPLIVPKRSMFNLSCQNILTFGFGELIPTYTRELLPGDHFKIKQSFNTRFLALLAPIMHRVSLYNSWFFVPYRLLWDKWEDFISPKDFLSSDGPAAPYVLLTRDDPDAQGQYTNTYVDYFDLHPCPDNADDTDVKVSPLRIAAIRKIWNDFYRDQNLQDELPYMLNEGGSHEWINDGNSYVTPADPIIQPLARAYASDYFTSALPWTQKGNPVFIPFGVSLDGNTVRLQAAELVATGNVGSSWGANQAYPSVTQTVTGSGYTNRGVDAFLDMQGATGTFNKPFLTYLTTGANKSDLFSLLGLDISNGTATINDLRTALALQRWLERNARGGTRYVEYLSLIHI